MQKYSLMTADEAVKVVKSFDRIYVQAGASTPTILTDALAKRASELRGVEVSHIITGGNAAYADPKLADSFYVNSFFLAPNVRHIIDAGNGSYTPIFLGELPKLFYDKIVPIDGVFISITPPDENGYCSLGVSGEACLAAMEHAKYIIAQVNEYTPRTYGDTMIHISKITHFVEHNTPLYGFEPSNEVSDVEDKIATNVAQLIEDEATLQVGIGSVPDAVLKKLTHLKNLGIHTELLTDGLVELAKKGLVTGEKKGTDIGKIVCTFAYGSQKMYDFMNNNSIVEVRGSDYTNNPFVIAKNPKMVSINSAIEVDITGQVCADSIGTRMFSGCGGQVDFVRGAVQSKGGISVIALSSTTKAGESRIVPVLKQGAGVVTSRFQVQYVATEYGIVNLQGKNLQQRQKELIELAHPNHRETIDKAFFEIRQKDK
jgi:4-hydroxybutyrate coenzyme A transferase